MTVHTEMGDVAPGAPLVTLQARASALRIASTVGLDVDQTDVLLESGVVNIDGSLSSGTSAASSATGGYASLTPGTRVTRATRTASAPADVAAGSSFDNNSHDLLWQGELVARVPHSAVSGVAAKTSFGEPIAGTSGTPVSATSRDAIDMRFTNLPTLDPVFGLDNPALYAARQIAVEGTEQANSTAYAGSAGGTAHSTSVGLTANTSTVQVLQTTVRHRGADPGAGGLGEPHLRRQRHHTVQQPGLQRGDQVPHLHPEPARPEHRQLLVVRLDQLEPQPGDRATRHRQLDPWAWRHGGRVRTAGCSTSGSTCRTSPARLRRTLAAGRVLSTDGNRVEARSTAMVSLGTVPLRTGEPLSAVNVSLGNLSCIAEDNR